ncbi:FAD-dependent oxidoreductase [Mycobacterium sp. ITM-2016-00316]|uniref:FAD-dependent oxidoreductase n=1 Tax=Mycobacterium sp. ITM-2016-00316 TaxID=2099695 RepID=UPI001304DD6F|nr:FAD-dependent oxidoreductase [Mycobacterium sp. ITM-2016-00316]WNG82098.1 FAD-dependent oxidoreductase [Mycobacterium sp. ITM-2016-00316]
MTEYSVVLGAGIAGLLAAAALADAGHRVSIIERDRLPENASARRGIPQGAHLHSLLAKGWQTMEELVPGLISDVVASGAHVLDDARLGARMHIQNGPYALNRTTRSPILRHWPPTK